MKMNKRHKLNVMENKCSRSMCRATRIGRRWNEEVRRKDFVGEKTNDKSELTVFTFLAHGDHMSCEQMTKRVYESKEVSRD